MDTDRTAEAALSPPRGPRWRVRTAYGRSGMTAILAVAAVLGAYLGIADLVKPAAAAGNCGVERWAVKTGTDADAGRVGLGRPTATTLAYLVSQPRPTSLPLNARVSPVETTVWVLDATLVEDKYETDSDYHLVLRDSVGHTVIAEIPEPGCVSGSSRFLAGVRHARNQFDSSYVARGEFSMVNVPVRVTGVGFFDYKHGQTGVAPNAVELHPVIDIAFNPTGPLPLANVASASPTEAAPQSPSMPSSADTAGASGGPSTGSPTAGQAGAGVVLVLLGLLVALTGLWVIVVGQIRPIRISGRKRGTAVLGAGIILLVIGGALTTRPTNTASPNSNVSPPPIDSPVQLSPSPSANATLVPAQGKPSSSPS